MDGSLCVITGPAQSGKTLFLLTRYRAALKASRPGSVLWLAPTWRAAADVRDRLLADDLDACWQPGIYTFAKFAEAIVESRGTDNKRGEDPFEGVLSPFRCLSGAMKRQLVRWLIDEQAAQGRLRYFQPIAGTSGLVDLVCEFISELKRLEIWPEQLREACQARGFTAKDGELLELYDEYQAALRENNLYDAEGLFWSARDRLQQEEGRGQGPCSKRVLSPFANLRLVVADGFSDFTRTQHEILQLLARGAEEMLISLPLEPGYEEETKKGTGPLSKKGPVPFSFRRDLFSKPLKTLDELRKRHANVSMQELSRADATAWPGMGHLERNLFVNPRLLKGPGPLFQKGPVPLEDIEILAAANPLGEMELIGARIKRLLADGIARPGEIAVVFRSAQDAGGLAAEVFDRLGIPAAWEMGQTLDRVPIMRALKALLQLDLDDWPFRVLLKVVGSNYFQPDWPEWSSGGQTFLSAESGQTFLSAESGQTFWSAEGQNAAAILEQAIRSKQIPHGRKTLLDQPFSDNEQPALAVLKRLAAALDALPAKATLPQWAKAWEGLAQEVGLLRVQGSGSGVQGSGSRGQEKAGDARATANCELKNASFTLHRSSFAAEDALAWDRLMSALADDDTLAGWLNRRPKELDRRGAFVALTDIVGSERMPVSGDEAGRVRVLSAASARSLHIPFLFLAGLSEKAFPPPDREGRLYSEAEYLKLIEKGLPLAARTERMRDEMLLFYETATRATRRLYLSYPALDQAAQPLLPSPYLIELEQAFGEGNVLRTEVSDLRPIPAEAEPLSFGQFRLRAMADALGMSAKNRRKTGDVSLLAGLLQAGTNAYINGQKGDSPNFAGAKFGTKGDSPNFAGAKFGTVPNILAGLELIILRQEGESLGPAEGVFFGEAAAQWLCQAFSSGRCFTASELESYAACPYRFLVEKILGVEPVDDVTLQLDVLERGQIVHNVLASFHHLVNQSLGRPGSPLELAEEEYEGLMRRALEESLPRPSSNPVQNALNEVNRRHIEAWLAEYRNQCVSYDGLWRQLDEPLVGEFFEASFGKSKNRDAAGVAVERAFEMPVDGGTIRISGRIDRIDTGKAEGRNIFNILDYKTGKSVRFSLEDVQRGTCLQLPLYALAARDLLLKERNAIAWQAGYWKVAGDGYKESSSLVMHKQADGGIAETDDAKACFTALKAIIPALVRNIRRGRFPVFSGDRDCTRYCPFHTVCRIRQIRAMGKTWQPTD
jgi:ATP-dependent helicase/nuclease subunit B